MNGAGNLVSRIAEAPKDRCTHQAMPGVALEAGLVIAAEAEGLSKRDQALAARDDKSPRELGEIARRLGAHWHDHSLEDAGCALLEEGDVPISEITGRDVAARPMRLNS